MGLSKEVVERVKQVLKDPKDKRYKVRVDVTMELDRPEFMAFLTTRDVALQALKEHGKEFGREAEYFKQVFMCGCQQLMKEIKQKSLECIVDHMPMDKFEAFLIKLMEEKPDAEIDKDL